MKEKVFKVKKMAFSSTARDSYALFIGKFVSSFFNFAFTFLAARALSVSDFGIFSAIVNFVVIAISISGFGISVGATNFISKALKNRQYKLADEYTKATFVSRSVIVLVTIILIFIFPDGLREKLFLSKESSLKFLISVILMGTFLWNFSPGILVAKRKFIRSAIGETAVALARPLFLILFIVLGLDSLNHILTAYTLSTVMGSLIVGGTLLGFGFLFTKLRRKTFVRLLRFSGWLGVGQVLNAVTTRLDVTMIAAMTSATITGYYSIASRLSFFVIMIATSYMLVLAPRMATVGNGDKGWEYVKKASLGIMPIMLALMFGTIMARPAILLMFGDRYENSVNIFRAIALSSSLYLISIPSLTAMIYIFNQTKKVAIFSIIQIVATVLLNYIFIPKFGAYAPALTYSAVYLMMAIYHWGLTLKYFGKLQTPSFR